MKASNINPYIRIAQRSIINNNIKQRVIYDYELIYVEYGKFKFQYNNIDYTCKSGDVIFICPGIPHSFYLNGKDVSQPHMHFDITCRVESEKIPISFKDICKMNEQEKLFIHKNYFLHYQKTPFVIFNDIEDFKKIFFEIIHYNNSKEMLLAKAKLIQLLDQLLRNNFPQVLETQQILPTEVQIKDYLDAYQGLKMGLDDFAKHFSYSKYHIDKNFKKRYGIALIKYRNIKRMEYAAHLIETMSVSSAAEELGYQSIYAFSRAFKQYYGHSPKKKPSKIGNT